MKAVIQKGLPESLFPAFQVRLYLSMHDYPEVFFYQFWMYDLFPKLTLGSMA